MGIWLDIRPRRSTALLHRVRACKKIWASPWKIQFFKGSLGIKNNGLSFFTGSLLVHRYNKLQTCISLICLLPTTAFSDPGEPPLSPTRSHLLWLQVKIQNWKSLENAARNLVFLRRKIRHSNLNFDKRNNKKYQNL